MRKLAKVVQLHSVRHHPNADRLDIVQWDGWQCVTKRGEFKDGDIAVALEVDSWVPTILAPFLTKEGRTPREFCGISGERLRTVKLRGEISQGLVLPISVLLDYDVSAMLGVSLWEAPEEGGPHIQGQKKGDFPSFIRKTDQTRAQSMMKVFGEDMSEFRYEVTLKLDGSSCTVFYFKGETGICSRNMVLKNNEANKDNAFIRAVTRNGLDTALAVYCSRSERNLAMQGEVIGPSIQRNPEGAKEPTLYIFDIFDIDRYCYLGHDERMEVLNVLPKLDVGMSFDEGVRYTQPCDPVAPPFLHVPIIDSGKTLKELGCGSLPEMLAFVDRPSLHAKRAEGCVFKSVDGSFSFKCINNAYLLAGEEKILAEEEGL